MDFGIADAGGSSAADNGDAAVPHDEAAETDELRDRLRQAEDNWRRAAADLDNLQKRYQRELDRGQTAERERTLGLWLETLDDLERALEHAETDQAAFFEGVRAITGHAAGTIASLGYPRFGRTGDLFDPALHEAVGAVPVGDGVEANAVVAVIKPGYGTAGHLLRPASVIVAKEPD